MTDQKKSKKRNMRSFEADPDVAQMLDDAVASGAQIKDLTNEALRLYGPGVLAKQVKELRKKADEIEKRISANKRL
jgi:hypothetical protein